MSATPAIPPMMGPATCAAFVWPEEFEGFESDLVFAAAGVEDVDARPMVAVVAICDVVVESGVCARAVPAKETLAVIVLSLGGAEAIAQPGPPPQPGPSAPPIVLVGYTVSVTVRVRPVQVSELVASR